MNCLDCATRCQQARPAVAVCQGCGAAICLEHTWVNHRAGHPPGMAGPARAASRVLRCEFCGTRTNNQTAAAAAVGSRLAPGADLGCLRGTGSSPDPS